MYNVTIIIAMILRENMPIFLKLAEPYNKFIS